MSTQPPSFKTVWLRAVGYTDLHPIAKLVALVIGAHMNPTGACKPSLRRVARHAGLHPSTVARRRREVIDAGLLAISVGGGQGRTSSYQGLIPSRVRDSMSEELSHHRDSNADLLSQSARLTIAEEPLTIAPPHHEVVEVGKPEGGFVFGLNPSDDSEDPRAWQEPRREAGP